MNRGFIPFSLAIILNFQGSYHTILVWEVFINKTIYPEGIKPTEGQIHLVVGGEDVVADFDPKKGKFKYHKEKKIYRGE